MLHAKTKHMEFNIFLLQVHIVVNYIPTLDQTNLILTKPLLCQMLRQTRCVEDEL